MPFRPAVPPGTATSDAGVLLLTTKTLLPITQLATISGDDPLAARFELAASLLTSTTAPDLLADVISSPSGRGQISNLVTGIDHVGFIADPRDEASIGAAARSAGFDEPSRSFPSTIIARELGEKVGRPSIPTTIVQAHGRSQNGSRFMAEAIVPHDVGDGVVRGWIRDGVAAHVAFRVDRPWDLAEIGRLMEGEGFRSPTFMAAGAVTNPAASVTIAYFDGLRDGHAFRLEFCHYG